MIKFLRCTEIENNEIVYINIDLIKRIYAGTNKAQEAGWIIESDDKYYFCELKNNLIYELLGNQ